MLLLLLFAAVWLSGMAATPSTYQYRKCEKVNGISGACNLHLNYFALAGTHNSGAGAYGLMYWYSGIVAPSCKVRNQDKNITEQLQLGIRYFDFYLAHIEQSSGYWWEKGLVLAHCNDHIGCAYSRSLKRAMTEIVDFLGDNRDEIVLVRLKDHAESSKDYIRQHLADELSPFQMSTKVRISPDKNPRLGDAITSNQRLLIHVNGEFLQGSPFSTLRQVEAFRGAEGSYSCFSVQDIVDVFLSDWERANDDHFPLQVDWYHNSGPCLWDLAGICDGMELHKLVEINKEMVRQAHRPINLVLIDYAGRGSVRLADIVREINEYIVTMFT